jgi:Malectin domain
MTCNRMIISILLGVTCALSASAQVTITPSTRPSVNQGGTFKFTANVAVNWSCPGCAGTIDPDGTYHAPQAVKSQQSYGGYQLLPNDHIFNTRIDSLPVNPSSAAWVAGAGTVSLNYLPSFPINYVDGSTPTANELFEYTPKNNGPFQIPAYPGLRVECGTLVSLSVGCDRHLLAIDTTNGTFQEIYDLVPVGAAASCSSCTSVSGVRYKNSAYNLPNAQGGGVDAAGLYVMPLTLRLQELEQAVATKGTVKHALRFTLPNGYIKFNSFIWPATATTSAGGGVVPYGARFRLKSGFNISTFSPIAQVLLTQLMQYGIILADGGYGWQITTEETRWPTAYRAAFSEIAAAQISPSNFEAVDESGLQVSASSGLTTHSETIVAMDASNPANVARQQVVLTGVTLNLPKDVLYIQAGTSAQQLPNFLNGSSNSSVTWTMSPAVGTLSAGLYTPPTSIPSATSAIVTATSSADPSVSASQTLTVLPAGTIRLVLGQTNPYTDSTGKVWQPQVGDDGCQPYDNGGTWPSSTDITLYKIACFSYNDIRFDLTVPNGTYQINARFAETENVSAGDRLLSLEAQGVVVYPNVDIYTSAGGMNKPLDFTLPASVTNGSLSFVVRHIKGDFALISALQIVPVSLTVTGQDPSLPAPPSDLHATITPNIPSAPPTLPTLPQTLSLVESDSGNTATVTVTSPGQFQLVWEAGDNWGLSQWYDLVNDPGATNNVIGPLYAVNGPSSPCSAEPGLANMVFYGESDDKLFQRNAGNGCPFAPSNATMTILYNTPQEVILQTVGFPMTNGAQSTDIIGTVIYYVFPNGKLYIHNSVHATTNIDLGCATTCDLFVLDMGLEDPTKTGTNPPDSQGFIRADKDTNPWDDSTVANEPYLFAYWNQNTAAPYAHWTYANVMVVLSPNNPTKLYQIRHSWSAGTGFGVVRWGYRYSPGPNMTAGQTISNDFLIQLGTSGSSVLPNITSASVATPIANAYIANPNPPNL